ncbi:glycerophosphodiester phosphodiesterase [Desulfurispira natronophila]|uniref:Glycerophosphoryl diester phosphodiesterase n=1 Tax=Desulfurispira natronophila TaxID=682562 RepID=A0A7W7Y6I5_9BACT|nr:glycerophosphoryl diester phosphodiesterase [Desulfurispira natronophila]
MPVLIHDKSTGRIAEEDLRVRETTYDELSRLTVYKEFKIPRLQDFLLECSHHGIKTVFLDIKVLKKIAVSSVIEVALANRDKIEIYALSKNVSVLEHIKRKANNGLKTGLLRISNDNMHDLVTRKNARYVDLAFVKNTDEGYSNNRNVIKRIKKKGLYYSASLINEIESYDMAARDGCQFVLTDRSDAFLQKG